MLAACAVFPLLCGRHCQSLGVIGVFTACLSSTYTLNESSSSSSSSSPVHKKHLPPPPPPPPGMRLRYPDQVRKVSHVVDCFGQYAMWRSQCRPAEFQCSFQKCYHTSHAKTTQHTDRYRAVIRRDPPRCHAVIPWSVDQSATSGFGVRGFCPWIPFLKNHGAQPCLAVMARDRAERPAAAGAGEAAVGAGSELKLSEPMAQCRKLLTTIMKKKEAGAWRAVARRGVRAAMGH